METTQGRFMHQDSYSGNLVLIRGHGSRIMWKDLGLRLCSHRLFLPLSAPYHCRRVEKLRTELLESGY